MTELSAAGSPAIVRYYNPHICSKYPKTLRHLPFRTRPMTQAVYDSTRSAQLKIGYEEIETILASEAGVRSPFGFLYVCHPLSQSGIRRFNVKILKSLKAWITEKDMYVGEDTQLKMFLEARKETLDLVTKEIFKRECAQVKGVEDACEWPESIEDDWEFIEAEDL